MGDAEKVLTWIIDHAAIWAAALAAWGVRVLLRVEQTLFGVEGKGGLMGRVEELEKQAAVAAIERSNLRIEVDELCRRLEKVES